MSNNIKKICVKYDNYIDLNFLNGSETLDDVSKEIKDTIDKKMSLNSVLIDNYNKKLISIDITGILDKFNIKNDILKKALIYGKTLSYYTNHPGDGNILCDVIQEINLMTKK